MHESAAEMRSYSLRVILESEVVSLFTVDNGSFSKVRACRAVVAVISTGEWDPQILAVERIKTHGTNREIWVQWHRIQMFLAISECRLTIR